jgi:hypothetical protein
MALRFQDVPIPFVAGQTAGADAALIQPPDVIRVTNGEFGDRGNIRAVDGLRGLAVTAMTGETAPDDTNPTLRRLLSHKDELLLETFKGTFRQQVGGSFALAAGSNNRKRNTLRAMRMGVTSIADSHGASGDDWAGDDTIDAGVLGVDAAQLGDYTCTVWIEKYGVYPNAFSQMMWQIRHKTSDALVGRGRVRDSVTNVVSEPRVVAFGGQFRIFAISGGDLGYLFIDPASTQNVAESVTKYTAGGAFLFMDVAVSPSHFCITGVDAGPAIQSFVLTQAAPTVIVGSPRVVVPGVPMCVGNMYVDAGAAGVQQAFVAFYNCAGSLGTLRWFAVSTAGVSLGVAAQALATVVPGRIVAFKDYAGSVAAYPVLIDGVQAGGAPQNFVVTSVQYNATAAAPGNLASAGTDTVLVREHICAGHPISVRGGSYDGTQEQGLLLPVQFASRTQNTFQVLDIARSLKSALGSGQTDTNFSVLRVFDAGALFSTHIPPLVGAFVIGRVCKPVLVPDSTTAAHFWSAKFTPNITNVTQLGQNPTNIQRNTLAYEDKLGFIEFADLTYMAGGCPLVYDGQDIFEEGFTFAPEGSITVGAGVTPLSVGSYSIVFVYEWFDGQGNRWQSAPSPAVAFTTTVGNQTYTASVRTLRTTLRSGVQVIPYRTTADDTVYYRDSPLAGAALPLTDTALKSSEMLYTGPGSLFFAGTQSNNALPGVKNFTEHQSRLVAVGGEFERGFFYSKERSLRFPAEFNRASGFGQIPSVLGRAAVASSLDDKLVIFAENGVAVTFGQGPNQNWLQNGYTTPVRIQAAEGIKFDSPFIAEVDDGAWYLTTMGPRLLSRGLATAKGPNGLPLGEGLRNSSQKLISACNVVITHPLKAQVWFCSTTDATTYIYDYQRDKWTERDDNSFPLAAVSTRGLLYMLTNGTIATTGTLRYEDPTYDVANALSIETGWFSFAGIDRFQRFTHLQVMGSTLAKGVGVDGVVGISVYEAHDPYNPSQVASVALDSIVGNNIPWTVEFQMSFQQGTAYKLFITVAPTWGAGGDFTLTSMLARVGIKSGGARLSNSQRG